MKIYLPKPTNPKPSTLGEDYFFKNKFWKLAVLFGYDWRSLNVVKTGFSFMNICSKYTAEHIDKIVDFLMKNNIKFRVEQSPAGWTCKLVISTKKSGLEAIDKAYNKFYKNKKKECKGLYIYENKFIDKDEYDELNKYYKKDLCLKQL